MSAVTAQRTTMLPERHRFTLPLTRLMHPCRFSIVLARDGRSALVA